MTDPDVIDPDETQDAQRQRLGNLLRPFVRPEDFRLNDVDFIKAVHVRWLTRPWASQALIDPSE